MWPSLPAGKFRHRDHRFEWTRTEFESWGNQVAETFRLRGPICTPLGPEDETVGAPSQMGVFSRVLKRLISNENKRRFACHSE